MKLGFVFPGQGAQSVGMGKDIYDTYESYRNVYKKVGEILGIDIAKLTFDSTEEELSKTKNTQIAILTMSLAILEILKEENIQADYLAGLSLGEYTALISSHCFKFEDGIKIVAKRGNIMQENIPEGNWSMAAIMGLEDEEVEKACMEASKNSFVVPANYNCPGQVVISGEKEGVEIAIEKAKELGAKRVIELKTRGPFHTEKLKRASDKLREELEHVEINLKEKTIIKNIDAVPYSKQDNMKDILAKHVINPVKFSKSISNMIEMGVDTFLEIGPGKVLSGFIKKINPDVNVLNTFNKESLEEVMKQIKMEGNYGE